MLYSYFQFLINYYQFVNISYGKPVYLKNIFYYKSNPIFHTLLAWTTQEDGSSVLFGKDEPEHDRYHGFHLYKAITRYCKDNAIPRRELQNVIKLFGTTEPISAVVDLVIP